MATTDKITELLLKQYTVTEELEKEIKQLEARDILTENETLRNELNQSKAAFLEAKEQISKLTDENRFLRNSLFEQIYNEKINILNLATRKIDVYFQSNINGEINRLRYFEQEARRRIDQIAAKMSQYRISSEDELFGKLQELKCLLDQKIAFARQQLEEQVGTYTDFRNEEYKKLREEELQQQEMDGALKKNNLEALIGLNVFNKIGILFLIIGVIALTQFTYFRLPEVFKSIFAFVGGGVLLLLGEILNRKRPNVFSLGLTSAGVAVSYVAIAVSYFGLKVITMYPALLICITITALSFWLSRRYNSQTVATFSLVGGYLPILSIAASDTLVYSAMIYFFLLNLLALSISYHKKWTVTALVGFGLNTLATAYIIALTLYPRRPSYDVIQGIDVITVLYIVMAFLNYTLIPLLGSYREGKKLGVADLLLVGLNTYFSAIMLYIAFNYTGFTDFKGLLAVVFAVSYFILARFIKGKLPEEKQLRTLFYITSFVFLLLFIPLQVDIMWLSLGWLVEGVALSVYGILKDNRSFRKYGLIACGFCLAAFLIMDVLPYSIGYHVHFSYKYTAVTLSSLLILGTYIYKQQGNRNYVTIIKYGAYVNLWIYVLYLLQKELGDILLQNYKGNNLNISHLLQALCITSGFLLAYTIPRIRSLYDKGIRYISYGIYGISILWLLLLNVLESPGRLTEAPVEVVLIASLILIGINLLSVLAMMDLLRSLVLARKLGTEWYPLILSVYLVLILTQNLLSQYDLSITNFTISMIYILLALFWIIFGFIRRYVLIRRFGLGFSFLAIAKLFLLDLSFLAEGYRIISYFAFGIVLIAISFVYQYFDKRLETKV